MNTVIIKSMIILIGYVLPTLISFLILRNYRRNNIKNYTCAHVIGELFASLIPLLNIIIIIARTINFIEEYSKNKKPPKWL